MKNVRLRCDWSLWWAVVGLATKMSRGAGEDHRGAGVDVRMAKIVRSDPGAHMRLRGGPLCGCEKSRARLGVITVVQPQALWRQNCREPGPGEDGDVELAVEKCQVEVRVASPVRLWLGW